MCIFLTVTLSLQLRVCMAAVRACCEDRGSMMGGGGRHQKWFDSNLNPGAPHLLADTNRFSPVGQFCTRKLLAELQLKR